MTKPKLAARSLIKAVIAIVAISIFSIIIAINLSSQKKSSAPDASEKSAFGHDSTVTTLRVLAYSSFISSWGPGPTLVRMFEHEYPRHHAGNKVKVELLQAEDAGLLLAKMKLFPADVIIGFDQFSRTQARKASSWKKHLVKEPLFSDDEFLAFDWAPIGFVYRVGEIDPPKSLSDLLHPRFKGKIALQDPRSSSPGYQFLSWIAAEFPGEKSVEYLKKLKPNVHSLSASWSQSYGFFSRGLASMVLSYATSPLYHRFTEKDERYRFAFFNSPHPMQVEFAAIPEACKQCDIAAEFLKFINGPPAQAVIMNKNWMLPVNEVASRGTPFAELTEGIKSGSFAVRPILSEKSDSDRTELLRRWQEVAF